LATPIVAGDGGDMRVMKEREKIRSQFFSLNAALANNNRPGASSCGLSLLTE
jgi:hypothetical protein